MAPQAGAPRWIIRFGLSLLGLSVTASILAVTVIEKFSSGGWLTLLVTGIVIALCVQVKRHYMSTRAELANADATFSGRPPAVDPARILPLDPTKPTAIVLVGKHRGVSMHALLWIQRLFPCHFHNFVFLAVGEVDAQSYEGQEALHRLQHTIGEALQYYVSTCQRHGLAADSRAAFETNPVVEFMRLVDGATAEFPNSVAGTTAIWALSDMLPSSDMWRK